MRHTVKVLSYLLISSIVTSLVFAGDKKTEEELLKIKQMKSEQSIMVLDPGDTAPNDTNIAENLEPLLVASNSFRVSRNMTFTSANEGTIKWWAATQDNVGNVPSFTDSRTAAQVANGIANPAVKGSGDPTNTASKKALPGNTVSLVLDVTPASPTTNPGKTGGKVDTALAVIPTGSHSAAGAHTTVLTLSLIHI